MKHGQQILAQVEVVVLDAGRLVVRPLVVGSGFVHDRGRVGAVRGDGYDREGDRQDGGENPTFWPIGSDSCPVSW